MASRERDMRATVVRMLKPFHAISVENAVGAPGTPDVNCSLGWIELKSVDKPKRDETRVRVDHWTKAQKIWLMKRWSVGGAASLLVKVSDYWLLFDPPTAFEVVGKLPFIELVDHSYNWWLRTPDKESFRQSLINICLRKTSHKANAST